jgi:RNA polymerase sigma factor (sigma-70 family)
MRHDAPAELSALLSAADGVARDDAWADFVRRHSRLLLHVARSHGGDRDTVMDRYAYILEQLRDDDFRRLRTWERDRRSKLTTWLTVVAQRMSLDLHRQRYGRPRGDAADSVHSRATRRRLADLLVDTLDFERGPELVLDPGDDPDTSIRKAELSEIVHDTVSELSSAEQLLLTLRFRDGLSAAAIARATGYPTPFHVYRELDRLLSRLRRSLRQRGVEDPMP